MESICVPAHPKIHGLSTMEPVTKLERDLIVGYRRLSSDDRNRILLVLQAMVSVQQSSEVEGGSKVIVC